MDPLALSVHEGAHACAATLHGIEWDLATIAPEDDRFHGFVSFPPNSQHEDPLVEAFVYWAGPAAESRITNTPIDDVLRRETSSHDLAHFSRFRSPRQERIWMSELDSIWTNVLGMAARLVIAGTLSPTTPDPLQDPAAIAAFLRKVSIERSLEPS